jgi:hypothetical protein
MTADDITRRLVFDLMGRSTVMPRFTPNNWWECDVAELTKAGFLREYEIKVSRSDFFADREKSTREWNRETHTFEIEKKHDLLASRDSRGPKQFYFVFPLGLITDNEIPEWAGYYTATERQGRAAPFNVRLLRVRKAPVLHTTKADAELCNAIHASGYWRFLRATYKGSAPIIGEQVETEVCQ